LKKFKNKTALEMSLEDRMESIERQFKNLQNLVFDKVQQRPDLVDV